MTSRTFTGRALVRGKAKGEALVSGRAFTFAHGVDPSTGLVTDVRSDIRGSNVKGKILFYPHGKGSTTASSWFLEAVRLGNHPVAVVTAGPDLSIVIGSVIAKVVYGKEIPVLSNLQEGALPSIKGGDMVDVSDEAVAVNGAD